MKKDEMETQIHALEDDLEDARKEIAWLRQSIYGSEKAAKLEEEIEKLNRDCEERYEIELRDKQEIEHLKEQLAIAEQAVGVSEWRRKECLRLEALNADLTQDIN